MVRSYKYLENHGGIENLDSSTKVQFGGPNYVQNLKLI